MIMKSNKIENYINIRNYASLKNSGMEIKGHSVKYPKRIGDRLEAKGLIQTAYSTKEDKEAIKFHIEHHGGPWYRVMQGKKEVDKLHKKDAEKLVKKLNAT